MKDEDVIRIIKDLIEIPEHCSTRWSVEKEALDLIDKLETKQLNIVPVMQCISKCAIMYGVNGLYQLINDKGNTIHEDTLQGCMYYKEAKDKKDGYTA